MRFVRAVVQTLAVTVALMAYMSESRAQFFGLFYAKADIQTHSEIVAGLDEPTRRVVMSMPAEIRAQVVETIRQSLPLINQSVSKFLEQVDAIVEQRINQAVCAGQAIGVGLAEEFTAAVFNSEKPKPVSDLVHEFDGRGTKFESGSAKDIAVEYEDFLHNAGITACRLADTSAASRVSQIRTTAREKWRVWVEIEKICSAPVDCLGLRYGAVKKLISIADQRDIEAAAAKAGLAQVNLVEPERGLWPRLRSAIGYESWHGKKAAWVELELELEKLRNIERSLEAASALRKTVAKRNLNEARIALLLAEQMLVVARSELSLHDPASNSKARDHALGALSDKENISTRLKMASTGDSGLTVEIDASHKKLGELQDAAGQIEIAAIANNKAIVAAAEAAAAAEELRRARDKIWRQWDDRHGSKYK